MNNKGHANEFSNEDENSIRNQSRGYIWEKLASLCLRPQMLWKTYHKSD